ncbi:MAG: peptidase dipeptidase [Solirubrobacterales bacterium]|nr:peptidase dipeptidase [Solirubrobacterales bacterium]
MTRTILAMGGGGFTMEPRNPALDDFILGLSGRPVPRICFLPTAGGDAGQQIAQFHDAFADRACETRELSLFRLGRDPEPLRDTLLSQDVIYVGGGSMRNMLAIWRAHGLDEILIEAWDRGVVLAGLSAGAMCWFEHGISTSSGRPGPVAGLGLLSGSLSVHRDGERHRLPVFRAAIADGTLPGGWAVDDGAALLFREHALARVVASEPGRGASRIDRIDGELREVELQADVLRGATPMGAVPADIREFRLTRRSASR